MQAEGFNLAAIKRLVERAPDTSDEILSALELVQQPFETEQPQVFTLEELRERFEIDDPDAVLRQAEKLGVLLPVGEDRYEAPAPSLLEVAAELAARGVPIEHALAVGGQGARELPEVAREFTRLFIEDVFRPFEAEGMPPARWPRILESIERLRPMSAQVVLAMYQLTMSQRGRARDGKRVPADGERKEAMKGDRLAEALGGRRVDGLAKLPAGVLDDVADMVLDARAAQAAALEESLDGARCASRRGRCAG